MKTFLTHLLENVMANQLAATFVLVPWACILGWGIGAILGFASVYFGY